MENLFGKTRFVICGAEKESFVNLLFLGHVWMSLICVWWGCKMILKYLKKKNYQKRAKKDTGW